MSRKLHQSVYHLVSLLVLMACASPIFGQFLVGYRSGDPVIVNGSTLKAFTISNDLTIHAFEAKAPGLILAINDCGEVQNDAESRLLIFGSVKMAVLQNLTIAYGASLSANCEFIAISFGDSIAFLNSGNLVKWIKGSNPRIVDETLYFSTDTEPYSPGMVDVWKMHLDDLRKPERVLANIFEPGILIFDHGNYVACAVTNDQGPKSAIYDVRHKRFRLVGKANPAVIPIYFPKTNELRFFDSEKNELGPVVQHK